MIKVKCIEKWQTFKVGKIYECYPDVGLNKKSWFIVEDNGISLYMGKMGYPVFDHKTCFEIVE
jgi:hypothetical protein